MFISLILILLLTFSGLALTYLYEREDSLLVRLSAGNIIGGVIFSLVGFLFACFFGLSVGSVLIALAVALLPLALFAKKDFRQKLKRDWQKAKGKLEGANAKKIFRFLYYVFFFALFVFFFDRAMFEMRDGIYTGGSQNLGDLPFHLGAIFSFTEGNNFPPENPSYAFAKFTYPFMADFLTACFVKLGASVKAAMLAQNVAWAFSLLVLLERFTFKLTGNRLAGKIAPVLLFFSGGFGFLWFFKDYWQGSQSFFEFFWKLPRDYTIGEKFRWGNSLVVLFITQRSLLFGMPLALIALKKLWEIFSSEKVEKGKSEKEAETPAQNFFTLSHFPFSVFLVGLLAGTLVLVHVHSLAVLFVVCAFLFFLKIERWQEWIAFGVGVAVVAVPELIWVMTGSATRLTEFVDWHFGWDSGKENFLVFWSKNIGIFIPILILGIYLIYAGTRDEAQETSEKKKGKNEKTDSALSTQHSALLLFYLPFAFLFVVSNAVKLAPWEWDNIKVLIYWFVGSLPFVAFALAWLWNKAQILKVAAIVCLIVLTLSGALDVWRTASGQVNSKVFETDAVKIAELIKYKTAPNALFLNAPTYNSAVVLTGRRSLMRYNGHLSSYGIDYFPRETEVKRIYEGTALADSLLQKNNIEYVLITPAERAFATEHNFTLNEQYFSKFPVIAEVGQYRVYKIK